MRHRIATVDTGGRCSNPSSVSWKRWCAPLWKKTTTCIAGLRQSGIIAPLVFDGPMPGEVFLAYVEQFLAPALEPGDVVVLDNLTAHKVDGVRQAITRAGAFVLYLPPYGPDLNPIEQLFAKLKALLRNAAAPSCGRQERAMGLRFAPHPPTASSTGSCSGRAPGRGSSSVRTAAAG